MSAPAASLRLGFVRARLFQSDENNREWGLHWTRQQKKRDDQDKAQD